MIFVEFATADETAELYEIFYQGCRDYAGRRRVSVRELGNDPPRDLAYKVMSGG
ncbi:MAG TPA: hypothetical protein VFI54_14930 [Solirubrobacteraceae bacterium]|nr:hypothetical protein [Solirubrobacteraceae bacterium]